LPQQTSTVSEEAYRAIEEAAGIKSPHYLFRGEIERCIWVWRERQGFNLTTVKPAGFRKAVLNIKTEADRLLTEIDRAKARSQEGWDYEYANIELGLEESRLAEQLTRLIETAKMWLKPEITPPGQGGRPPIPTINCLEEAYYKATNRSHSAQPPFRFFRACRDQFDLSLPKNDATLRRAISRYRERAKSKQDKTSKK